MHESNPYSAPQANVEPEPATQEQRLGGRGERLGAALIDGLIVTAVILPIWYATGYWTVMMNAALAGQRPAWTWMVGMAVVGVSAYVAIQGYPLANAGQTWGKKLLKLKIVDLDGRKPSLVRLICLRYLSTRLLAMIPVVGAFYSIGDALLIFRDDKRCIHDHIAGTRVVVAD